GASRQFSRGELDGGGGRRLRKDLHISNPVSYRTERHHSPPLGWRSACGRAEGRGSCCTIGHGRAETICSQEAWRKVSSSKKERKDGSKTSLSHSRHRSRLRFNGLPGPSPWQRVWLGKSGHRQSDSEHRISPALAERPRPDEDDPSR